jgi:hypothetical protein
LSINLPIHRQSARLSKRIPVNLWSEAGFLKICAGLLIIVIHVQHIYLSKGAGRKTQPEAKETGPGGFRKFTETVQR